MTSTENTATPTDAERALAHRIWNDALCNSEVPGWKRDDLLAQVLADQRAKYEHLADDLIDLSCEAEPHEDRSFILGQVAAAERIRKVAQQ